MESGMGMRAIVVLLWGFVTWRWLGRGLGALVGQYLFGCNMKV